VQTSPPHNTTLRPRRWVRLAQLRSCRPRTGSRGGWNRSIQSEWLGAGCCQNGQRSVECAHGKRWPGGRCSAQGPWGQREVAARRGEGVGGGSFVLVAGWVGGEVAVAGSVWACWEPLWAWQRRCCFVGWAGSGWCGGDSQAASWVADWDQGQAWPALLTPRRCPAPRWPHSRHANRQDRWAAADRVSLHQRAACLHPRPARVFTDRLATPAVRVIQHAGLGEGGRRWIRYRWPHDSSTSRTVGVNSAAGAPSKARWSQVRLRVRVGRARAGRRRPSPRRVGCGPRRGSRCWVDWWSGWRRRRRTCPSRSPWTSLWGSDTLSPQVIQRFGIRGWARRIGWCGARWRSPAEPRAHESAEAPAGDEAVGAQPAGESELAPHRSLHQRPPRHTTPTTTRLTTRRPFAPSKRTAATASSTNTNMPPDQPRHDFGHPQGRWYGAVGVHRQRTSRRRQWWSRRQRLGG